MFRKYFHNHIINLITRFVVATLLVVMLSGVAAPLAQAQGTNSDSGTAVGNFIGNMIITVGASFAAMGGKALDFSVDLVVVRMGTIVNEPGLKGAIDSLWTVIRDICNLAFIFAFIYVGIRTILDADNAGTKRMLAQIIIGAFLINFSLLFTKIIIDFSNLTATAIKDAMLQQDATFSTGFTQQLGLGGLYDIDSADKLANLTKGGGIWFSLMATLFLLVTAFVFMAGAVLLMVRFVALIFIMIFSPVLFAATLFPQTSDYAKKLLSSLISYSFFAPAYFLLMLISMRVVEALRPMTGSENLATAISTGKTTMSGSVILFIIAIIFMVQSLLLAQKLGMAGGNMAVNVGNKVRGGIQSFAGRNTFGRAGEYISRKQKEGRESDSKWSRAGALALRGTGINMAASAASTAKWGGSTSRVDAKKQTEEIARARGQSARVTTLTKDITAGASSTATAPQKIQMEKALASASNEQVLKLLDTFKESTPEYDALIANMSTSQFDALMKAKPEELDDAKKQKLRENRAKAVEARVTSGATLASTIGKADAKDLDALDFTTVFNNAGQLTTKQIDDMNLTPTAKKQLKDKRVADLRDEFNAGGPGMGAATLFTRITSEAERAKLPRDILIDPMAARYLTQGVLTKMLDNEGVLATDRAGIRGNVVRAHLMNPTLQAKFIDFFDNAPAGKQYV